MCVFFVENRFNGADQNKQVFNDFLISYTTLRNKMDKTGDMESKVEFYDHIKGQADRAKRMFLLANAASDPIQTQKNNPLKK